MLPPLSGTSARPFLAARLDSFLGRTPGTVIAAPRRTTLPCLPVISNLWSACGTAVPYRQGYSVRCEQVAPDRRPSLLGLSGWINAKTETDRQSPIRFWLCAWRNSNPRLSPPQKRARFWCGCLSLPRRIVSLIIVVDDRQRQAIERLDRAQVGRRHSHLVCPLKMVQNVHFSPPFHVMLPHSTFRTVFARQVGTRYNVLYSSYPYLSPP